MILADKIINLRKKAGMSQEDLAYKLNVSRQSVSKWEGAQSVPDINKIIEMAKVFSVSTDYLLKDEIEDVEYQATEEDENESHARKVSMEEASEYLAMVEKERVRIGIGTFITIIAPAPLIVLSWLASLKYLDERIAVAIGLAYLFVSVIIAVMMFVTSGMKYSKFSYLKTEIIDTEYGVSGLVKEKWKEFRETYNRSIVYGSTLCLIAVVPLVVFSILGYELYMIISMGFLLLTIAIAVYIFIYTGLIKMSYHTLLQEGEYSKAYKTRKPSVAGAIMGSYWSILAVAYLTISFLTNAWDKTWIIFVLGGVLHPIISAIVLSARNKKDNK